MPETVPGSFHSVSYLLLTITLGSIIFLIFFFLAEKTEVQICGRGPPVLVRMALGLNPGLSAVKTHALNSRRY